MDPERRRPTDAGAAAAAASTTAARSSETLQAELEALRATLKHAHRLSMLGTLAGSIAHEFNNILTPVMSYAEMALDEPADAALTRKALERAYQGCDRASRIAASILAFAADSRPADQSRADVAGAVRNAIACLAAGPERYGITLAIDIQPGCTAGMDQVGLEQVLLNLILNAIKAMRGQRRAASLTIRGFNRRIAFERSTWNTGRDDVVIEVEDTGCGIREQDLPRIFAPFVSGSPSEGTGLGLTICKQLIEMVGGTIGVRSQLGVGTCFTLVLPPAQDAAKSEPARAAG